MQRPTLNPITTKRLQKLRADYIEQLKGARERIEPDTIDHYYLTAEIDTLEASTDNLGQIAKAAK